jgi:hypothetical protein
LSSHHSISPGQAALTCPNEHLLEVRVLKRPQSIPQLKQLARIIDVAQGELIRCNPAARLEGNDAIRVHG